MHANVPDLRPVKDDRSRDPFGSVSCPALLKALREVSVEWAPRWETVPDGEPSLNGALKSLAQGLDTPGAHTQTQKIKSQYNIRLLKALQRNLFEQWHRKILVVEPERLLTLLYSAECLAEQLVNDSTDNFTSRLAESDAFKLVAEVAHDLRSPLTSILFLSEALRNGHSGSVSGLQQRQLGLIYSAALGLTGVANDLMTVAQEGTSGVIEEPVAFSFHQTFEALHEMVAPMAESKRIALGFGVHCFGNRVGHPGPIGRVLLNLTTNAIKFTREGGSVEVLADPVAPDAVEISVRDTGRGIAPEDIDRLFEPFQKSTGREGFFFAASGLGLTIVRRLLEGMESELKVESKVGEGTRFSFMLTLPRTH